MKNVYIKNIEKPKVQDSYAFSSKKKKIMEEEDSKKQQDNESKIEEKIVDF